ncbi:hypothetical protein, conserved [Eimeria tenella]|uniref:Transmembrane protein n=1 Tax=Eimeria tenella TaxID=5802 RepID=U6KQD8_EIMTE|nr:hypothetical protein, conserved [Eimeria tenella]CDJ40181.1 hypothetical protein, conserved [Eimeria tenella]|eukprot:XP_013230934.1 hypothetical protein, conserved [Eimeria tenella]
MLQQLHRHRCLPHLLLLLLQLAAQGHQAASASSERSAEAELQMPSQSDFHWSFAAKGPEISAAGFPQPQQFSFSDYATGAAASAAAGVAAAEAAGAGLSIDHTTASDRDLLSRPPSRNVSLPRNRYRELLGDIGDISVEASSPTLDQRKGRIISSRLWNWGIKDLYVFLLLGIAVYGVLALRDKLEAAAVVKQLATVETAAIEAEQLAAAVGTQASLAIKDNIHNTVFDAVEASEELLVQQQRRMVVLRATEKEQQLLQQIKALMKDSVDQMREMLQLSKETMREAAATFPTATPPVTWINTVGNHLKLLMGADYTGAVSTLLHLLEDENNYLRARIHAVRDIFLAEPVFGSEVEGCQLSTALHHLQYGWALKKGANLGIAAAADLRDSTFEALKRAVTNSLEAQRQGFAFGVERVRAVLRMYGAPGDGFSRMPAKESVERMKELLAAADEVHGKLVEASADVQTEDTVEALTAARLYAERLQTECSEILHECNELIKTWPSPGELVLAQDLMQAVAKGPVCFAERQIVAVREIVAEVEGRIKEGTHTEQRRLRGQPYICTSVTETLLGALSAAAEEASAGLEGCVSLLREIQRAESVKTAIELSCKALNYFVPVVEARRKAEDLRLQFLLLHALEVEIAQSLTVVSAYEKIPQEASPEARAQLEKLKNEMNTEEAFVEVAPTLLNVARATARMRFLALKIQAHSHAAACGISGDVDIHIRRRDAKTEHTERQSYFRT